MKQHVCNEYCCRGHRSEWTFYFAGFGVLTTENMKSDIFWDAISCSMIEAYWLSEVQTSVIPKFEHYVKLPTRSLSVQTFGCFFLVSYLAHSSNLKMQEVRPFETHKFLSHYTASHSRRQYSSFLLFSINFDLLSVVYPYIRFGLYPVTKFVLRLPLASIQGKARTAYCVNIATPLSSEITGHTVAMCNIKFSASVKNLSHYSGYATVRQLRNWENRFCTPPHSAWLWNPPRLLSNGHQVHYSRIMIWRQNKSEKRNTFNTGRRRCLHFA